MLKKERTTETILHLILSTVCIPQIIEDLRWMKDPFKFSDNNLWQISPENAFLLEISNS